MIKVAGVLLVSYKSQAAKDLSVIKYAGVKFANFTSLLAWPLGSTKMLTKFTPITSCKN
jgi:hypothetical protein